MIKEKKKIKACPEQSRRVVIAMSGGVDSSVAAALLKEENYDVVGVFMRFWKEPGVGENRCCSPDSERRARQVAKILKIPFYVFNLEKEFKKKVVDYFIKGYKEGITPNPCVVCNKEIKFGLLLEKALKLDADYIATGHYARKGDTKYKIQNTRYKLLKGKDKEKDQSYFLWQLGQEQLSRILFPVGGYRKDEVRRLAKKFKLPFAKVPESMEICFVPTTVEDFLKRYLKTKPGPILTTDGKEIGRHQGLPFYTIGQRKGTGLSGGPAFAKATAGKPYYVVGKDLKKNELIVSQDEKDLLKKELIAKNVNWLSGKEPKLPLKVSVKIRYHHPAVPATLTNNLKPATYNLKFAQSQRAVTPGQSVVFYLPAEALAKEGRGNELLGGGVIDRII